MPTIAVAAISSRAMAEAAARDGWEVIALDLFGDVDTRRAATRWQRIGSPAHLQIETASVLAALRALAEQGDGVWGWVAGSGFEGYPDVLEQGAAVLPLIGTAPEAVRRLRDPAAFFGFLLAHVIPFPPVRWEPPEHPEGWLLKDAHGCGGWHVGPVPASLHERPTPHHYFQREMAGQPMSATFIANGHEVQVLGFNLQQVRGVGPRPFTFCGAIGPVPLPPGLARRLTVIARAITREFDLRGLCSLDFMRDGDTIAVLEVNPRPPATLSLYPEHGVMRAHVGACLHGALPTAEPASANQVHGFAILFATRAFTLAAVAAQQLAAWPGICDLPEAGQRFEIDEPVCTLSARGGDAAQVRALLDADGEKLLQFLETSP
jgi:predicted ATP-grasp superfamily ATP-dependent carboligase